MRELIEFAGYYVSAQIDRLKLTVQSLLMFVVLGVIAAFVGVAVVFTAGVLLVVGVAEALAMLFGGRMWLGDLVTSLVILGVVVAGTVIVFKKLTMASRKRLVATYEQRKHAQRTSFGTDVDEQSKV